MLWKTPPLIKIYEALGCIADERVMIEGGNIAKVTSSSGNKVYEVIFDPAQKAIMVNDNGSYWQGYLGYPAIAFLMKKGLILYQVNFAAALKGIAWKDMNVRFKNDFDKTRQYIDILVAEKGIDLTAFQREIQSVLDQILYLKLSYLGKKIKPPSGY